MDVNQYKNKQFVPAYFLTIYEESGASNDTYLEMGKINFDGQKYSVGASAPVKTEFLQELVSNIKATNFEALQFKDIIPSNLLYIQNNNEKPSLIWYREPEKRYLHFLKETGIETGEYQLPKILFFLHDEELSVFRVDDQPITKKTKLYLLPLPNIHEDSTVCLGIAKLKEPRYLEDVIQNFEDMFYKTRFNALHNENYFDDGIIYTDVVANKNVNEWPKKLSEKETLNELFDELS